MSLTAYRTLGRSGLVVSPLALGAMTFGMARWGMGEADARAVFNAYVDLGGNFLDTADVYSGGLSEQMLGKFIAERGLRDQMVIATKSGFAAGNQLHSGGNGSRHIYTALEGSLRRLGTDHVDLYWIHVWDGVTPAEELLQTMASLVRAGKIRYWGLSNSPAWYVAQLVTLAKAHGLSAPIALQYFYSLANRDIEDEHVPLAVASGLGVVSWGPLASGLLTGKYDRATVEAAGSRAGGLPPDAAAADQQRSDDDKRLDGANPFGDTLFTEQNWAVLDVLRRVAAEAGQTPARMALAWVMGRRAVASTLMGVSRVAQVHDNVAALDLVIGPEHQMALDTVSGQNPRMLYTLFTPGVRQYSTFGGNRVAGQLD
ncbi:MAG: aldo/keto reductase [Devosia sp.]|nr:aldo/keto reductase [Devosia sp.]